MLRQCLHITNICKHSYYKLVSKFNKVLIFRAEMWISLVVLPQSHPVHYVIVDYIIIIEQCWQQKTVNAMALIIKNVTFLREGVNCNTVKWTAWLVPVPWHFYYPRGPFKGQVSVSVGMFHSFWTGSAEATLRLPRTHTPLAEEQAGRKLRSRLR